MNMPPPSQSALLLLACLAPLALGLSPGFAQTAASAADKNVKITDDQVIELSPFIVTADEDKGGYQATSTLAGTRVRTELKDIASAISVVTQQFLDDTAVNNNQGLLVYTTNTEVGGVYGNYSGLAGTTTFNEAGTLRTPQSNTRVRGLDSADNTRDYFLTNIPWDGYNVGRIDIQRGPNSILFGVGSPAGIINASVNTAGFVNSNKIEIQIDKFGSVRNSVDFNHVLLKGELAIRVSALDDRSKFQQKPAFNNDRRYFAAIRYDPKLFGDSAHTSIRANYENGRVNADRPRVIPPVDAISPWFWTGNDPKTVTAAHPTGVPFLNKIALNPNQFGALINTSPWYTRVGQQAWADTGAYYGDPSNGTASYYMETRTNTFWGITNKGLPTNGSSAIGGFPQTEPFGINGYHSYAGNSLAGIPGGQYYSDVSLKDPSVFDFFNKLIDGPNKREWQGWDAFNVAASQTFFGDRLGFELGYDSQRYYDGQINFLGTPKLSIDYNTLLDNQAPNPNFGRPYVANSTEGGNSARAIDRSGLRFTATGELRGEDFWGKSGLASMFGRQVFTGLYSTDTTRTFSKQWAQSAAAATGANDYGNTIQGPNGDILTNHIRAYDYVVYLGGNLSGASSPAGAGIGRINTIIQAPQQVQTTYFDSHWAATGAVGAKPYVDFAAPFTYTDPVTGATVNSTQSANPNNYVGWTTMPVQFLSADRGDIDALTYLASKQKENVTSKSFVWQGYLFDGNLVPTFGWRRDTVTDRSGVGLKDALGVVSTNFDYAPDGTSVTGQSKTWGIMAHLPESLAAKLPLGMGLSAFYNRGQNFQAAPLRADVVGNALPNPIGKTKEYGVVVSALHNKVALKVSWYENTVANATLAGDSAGFGGNLYQVWAMPAWGTTFAAQAEQGLLGNNPGNSWIWNYASVAKVPNTGLGDPAFENSTAVANERAALAAWKTMPLNQAFFNSWGFSPSTFNFAAIQAGNIAQYIPNWTPSARLDLQQSGLISPYGTAPVATVDTLSKGNEFELVGQPTKNWNISVNASKTFATRSAINPTVIDFMSKMTAFFNGPAGNIELWGSTDTVRNEWNNNIAAAFQVLQDQRGSSAPEVAPWRFNAVTTYILDEGALKGVFFGGGYRWEDARVLGYMYNTAAKKLDISQPFYGPADTHVDMWLGYSHKFGRKINWKVQLNLQNLAEKTRLVPISIQPDGSVGFSRIQQGMVWRLTNTFTF